jgi:hypothetical protein
VPDDENHTKADRKQQPSDRRDCRPPLTRRQRSCGKGDMVSLFVGSAIKESGPAEGEGRHGWRERCGGRGSRPRRIESSKRASAEPLPAHRCGVSSPDPSREAQMFKRLLRILRIKRYFRKRK